MYCGNLKVMWRKNTGMWKMTSYFTGPQGPYGRERVKPSRCIKASFYIPENRPNFPTTKGFRKKISIKLAYQYIAIFFNFSTTSNHLHPLQVENCDSNSRLVVDEDDNGKFRLDGVNGWQTQQQHGRSYLDSTVVFIFIFFRNYFRFKLISDEIRMGCFTVERLWLEGLQKSFDYACVSNVDFTYEG